MAYTKLFNDIIFSSVWREDDKSRLLWITMLAMCDYNGNVMAAVPGLADAARISLEECKAGLKKFMSPDKYSRNKDHEGRRIKEIPGGWNIINYQNYLTRTDKRTYQREYMRQYRAKKQQRSEPTTDTSDLRKLDPNAPKPCRKPIL